MIRSALRYLSVFISRIGTRAGRASYGSNRRHLVSKRFCPLLLVLGKAPRGLEIKATVQHNGDVVQSMDGSKDFSCGRHLCWLVTLIVANEEMLESDAILACLAKDPVGTRSGKCEKCVGELFTNLCM